jgi:hypothetical protein
MTAQIPDTFFFKGEAYVLIGKEGGELASPRQFGMEPEMLHTACYRGFYATYELTEDGLYLRELTLREQNDNYLPIGGIEPVLEEYQATYHDLGVMIPFTGKIRLAKDFIDELYVHMGYQKPTAFRTVLDITLENGRLLEIKDRSQEMEQKRLDLKQQNQPGQMMPSVEEAFSLAMDSESSSPARFPQQGPNQSGFVPRLRLALRRLKQVVCKRG